MDKIKAVLFDLDGVLVEAKEWHYEALNLALGLFGMEISRYEHLVTYDGLPTKRKLEMLSLERGLPVALHDFISMMKQRYTMEMIYTRCKPKFNHEFALSRLRSMGYRIAVCSNAVRDSVELMLDRANLTGYVEFVLSNEDVSKNKPDPEIYLKAFERMGLSPKECIIVEDNQNGIKAALASGGRLLEVATTEDVTFNNIMNRISEVENNLPRLSPQIEKLVGRKSEEAPPSVATKRTPPLSERAS